MMTEYTKELEKFASKLKLGQKEIDQTEHLSDDLSQEEINKDFQSFFSCISNGYEIYLASLKEKGCETERESSEKNYFLLFFGGMVNLYFLTGMHLRFPEAIVFKSNVNKDEEGSNQEEKSDTTAEEKSDTTAEEKSDTTAEGKSDTSSEGKSDTTLEENKNYFLEKLEENIQEEGLLEELNLIFQAISTQDIKKFREIEQKFPSFLVSHYLFHCHVDLYFKELQKYFDKKQVDPAEVPDYLKRIQDDLSLSYAKYQAEVFPLKYNDDKTENLLCPQFPLPYFRYNVAAVNTLADSIEIISKIKNTAHNSKRNRTKDLKEVVQTGKLEKNLADLQNLLEDKEVGTVDLTNSGYQSSVDSFNQKEREHFLKMPYYVDMKRSTFIILLNSYHTQYQLEEKKNRLEAHKRQREKLFEEQSHNWKHTSYPDVAISVAKELQKRGTEEDIFLSNKLGFVYVVNTQLLNNINLLRMEYGANEENFPIIFRKDVFRKDVKKLLDNGNERRMQSPQMIEDILVNAFELVAFRMFTPDSDPSVNAKTARDNIINKTELSHLTQSFYDEFLVKKFDTRQLIPWFTVEGYPITFEASPMWKEIIFEKNKPCYAVLMNFITNLLLNAINYGVKSKEGRLSIAFTQEEKEGTPYLCIVFENKKDSSSHLKDSGSLFKDSEGKGLEGIENRLQNMNVQKKLKSYVVTNDLEGNIFRTELWMERDAFWLDEEDLG